MMYRSKGTKAWARYGSLGFELLASIAVGYYLGVWADKKLGTRWIALVGFLVGCYAGFRALFRAAKQMTRDIEREEKLERGEDPWGDSPPLDDDVGDTDRTAKAALTSAPNAAATLESAATTRDHREEE